MGAPLHAWHALTVDQVIAVLKTTPQGLGRDHVTQRLHAHGPNLCEVSHRFVWFKRLVAQFTSPFILILAVALLVSVLLGDVLEGWAIVAVILLNGLIGFIQEVRAERAAATLRRLLPAEVTALRDGQWERLAALELVAGDVIRVEDGMRIPADARLLNESELLVDESLLTGEAQPVRKSTERLALSTPLATRLNMLYAGTFVRSGAGEAVVVATGCQTALGAITTTLTTIERRESPLGHQLRQLGRWIMIVIAGIVALVFLMALVRHDPAPATLLLVAALAVAAIPEGLPILLTVALIHGVRTMARRGVLVRRLIAVETAGTVTHIIVDKTGTLTENALRVTHIFFPKEVIRVSGEGYAPEGEFYREGQVIHPLSHSDIGNLLEKIAVIPRAQIEHEQGVWTPIGDPTEVALTVAAQKAYRRHGLPHQALLQVIDELPFRSSRGWAATIFQGGPQKRFVVMRGAPEAVLQRCTHVFRDGAIVRMGLGARRQFLNEVRTHVRDLRMLGVAYRSTQNSTLRPATMRDLILCGIVGMEDPLRGDALTVVQGAHKAGITVMMVTGDDPTTAASIGGQVGIVRRPADVVSLGDDPQLRSIELNQATVFARVSPKEKLAIVRGLQKEGARVAMTGDGSNDAPALARADVGIAMGLKGTDTAREAADIILTTDRFDQIIAAIEEGRTVFRNVRRTVLVQIGTNIAEVALIISILLGGGPTPLLPLQILWVNLVTDTIAGSALAFEPKHFDVLKGPPLPKNAPLLSPPLVSRTIIVALSITLVAVMSFWWGITHGGLGYARTLSYLALVAAQFGVIWGSRSVKFSIFTLPLVSNRPLIFLSIAAFSVALLPVTIPALAEIFGFTNLDGAGILIMGVALTLTLGVVELDKFARLRRKTVY